MADYDTGRDIVEDMLSRAGELNFAVAELSEEAKRYANRAYFTIVRQFPWLFAEGYPPLSMMTTEAIKVSITVEQGSTVMTTDTPSPNEYGYRIFVEDNNVPFRVVPDTSIPINHAKLPVPYPFSGGENLSGYLYKDEYFTPDVLIASRIKNMSRPNTHISIVGYEELDSTMPLSIPFGTISKASFYSEEYIRLAMIPEKPELLEIHYSKRPPKLNFTGSFTTDMPILPHDERWMIADFGLYFLMKDHGDDRADDVAAIAAGRIAELKDRQLAKMSPRIYLPSSFNIAVQ
jgi:hypothetical protein